MNWRKINMKYIPVIGDVVLYGGGTTPKVVVDMKNHEDFGSCCYDREYLLCDKRDRRVRERLDTKNISRK